MTDGFRFPIVVVKGADAAKAVMEVMMMRFPEVVFSAVTVREDFFSVHADHRVKSGRFMSTHTHDAVHTAAVVAYDMYRKMAAKAVKVEVVK